MYRLHKRFSALELERAYGEIEQLQVSGQPSEGRLGRAERGWLYLDLKLQGEGDFEGPGQS